MISKLSAPPADIEQVKQAIFDKINELIEAVNQVSSGKATGGNPGDMRVVQGSDKFTYIEVRTANGWARSSAFSEQPK